MAVAAIRLDINSDEFKRLRDKLARFLPPKQAAPVMAAALRKAVVPLVARLRQATPVGPTGNLRRAVAFKVVQYKNDGVAVAVVGYRRSGTGKSSSAAGGSVRAGADRAFHQWFLEFGTKQRTVQTYSNEPYARRSPTADYVRTRKGQQETVRGRGVVHRVSGQNAYIASSFSELGPFKFSKGSGKQVQTSPAYQKAFFKKSKKGTALTLNPTPIGGISGQPPIQTAIRDSQGEVAAILQQELAVSLGQAWAAMQFKASGAVDSDAT